MQGEVKGAVSLLEEPLRKSFVSSNRSFLAQFFLQLKLLLWKRKLELTNQKYEIAKFVAPPLLSFLVVLLIYKAFDGVFVAGTLEV